MKKVGKQKEKVLSQKNESNWIFSLLVDSIESKSCNMLFGVEIVHSDTTFLTLDLVPKIIVV